MLKINVYCVGTYKEHYWKAAEKEYLKRLSRFFEVNIIELKEQGKMKESEDVVKRLSGYSILLDISGEPITSEDMAQKIAKLSQSNSKINFIIGGSDGVCESVREKVQDRISFGKITLPHQLARVVLLEQIYRSATILNNIKYHK